MYIRWLSTSIDGGFSDNFPNLTQNSVTFRNFNHYETREKQMENFQKIVCIRFWDFTKF